MTITDRTRKLLWARAGGRCSICGVSLTEAATDGDPAAVLGEECHIAPRSTGGPRARERATTLDLDSYDNLILLCAHDHYRVDGQPNEFSAIKLRQLKVMHEERVARRLASADPIPAVRVVAEDEPGIRLHLIASGQQIWDLVAGAQVSSFEYPDDLTSEQIDVAADVLKQLEVVEIRDVLNMGDIMIAQQQITDCLDGLRDSNLVLYAGRRKQRLEFDGRRVPWSLVLLRFFRADDPYIHRRPGQAQPEQRSADLVS